MATTRFTETDKIAVSKTVEDLANDDSGIIIANSAATTQVVSGTIAIESVGNDANYSVGDRVQYNPVNEVPITVDGEELFVINKSDVFIVEKES